MAKPFRNLQSFLKFLEKKGDLLRIRAEVDPLLEITEIATRVVKTGGPALLFENVKGSQFPLVINVLGAERRVTWALQRSPAAVGEDLAGLAESLTPPSAAKLWSHRGAISRALAMRPKKIRWAPVKGQKIEPVDLDRLPVAQSWPKDGGRFITFPLVVTKSPRDGKQNMGVYRMHVYGKNQTGMHWQIAKGGGYHYGEAEGAGERLPLAAVVGADPLLMMCGVLPLPEGMDEMSFAGFLRGESTRVARAAGGALFVPAEAEFILEGFVPPSERRMEGPYGDHFGHYSLAAPFPVFHVERVWHRRGAVFPIAVVGKPPQEDQVIGDAVQDMLLPLLKIMHPELVDLWAYQEAGFHNLLVASVRQRFEKEAVKTGLWILGEGQLALSKCVVLVDPSVNARSFPEVLKAVRENFDPSQDFILLPGTSQDTLDFTSFKMNLGSKMIIDATGVIPASRSTIDIMSGRTGRSGTKAGIQVDSRLRHSGMTGDLLQSLKSVDARIRAARFIEDTLLVVQVTSNGSGSAGREVLEKMLSFPPLATVPLIAAVSPDVPLNDPVLLIWGIFTRFDCARDTFFGKTRLERGHPVYEGPLLIDATWKPGYPEPLEMDPAVVKKVDRRWHEYGFH